MYKDKTQRGRTKCDAPVRQDACFKHSQAPGVPDTYILSRLSEDNSSVVSCTCM
jgi:hypothetical protein